MDAEEVPAAENVEETQDVEDTTPADGEEVTEENTDGKEESEAGNEGGEEERDEGNGGEEETGGDQETGESNTQAEENEETVEPAEAGENAEETEENVEETEENVEETEEKAEEMEEKADETEEKAEETNEKAEEAKENDGGENEEKAEEESNAADDGDGEKEADTEDAAAGDAVDENGIDENGDGENEEAEKEEEAAEPEAENVEETKEEVEEPVNDTADTENGETEEKEEENEKTNGDVSHIPDFTAMSTQATPEDLDALKQAIADVRSDDGGVGRKSWVLVGHLNNNPNVVGVIGQDVSGEASLESFVERLEDDQVMYGLIRLTTTVDMSNTVKFVYVHWAGDNVPFAKKGRFGVVHGSVVEHFMPYHVQVETGNKDELAEEELVKLLEESSFTRNKVIEGDNMANRQQRGFTAHQVNRKRDGELRSVAPKGLAVEVEPELNQLIGEVRSDKEDMQWVLAGYKDGNLKKPLTVVGSGTGDIEELKESLQDDQVMYGLIRTADLVDEIHTVKFVYIYWVGENVKPMTKGKVSAYAGPVEQIFSPIHVSLNFSNRHDMLQEVINDKVMAGSGSKSFVK